MGNLQVHKRMMYASSLKSHFFVFPPQELRKNGHPIRDVCAVSGGVKIVHEYFAGQASFLGGTNTLRKRNIVLNTDRTGGKNGKRYAWYEEKSEIE